MVLLPLTPVIKDTISLEIKIGHVTTVNGWEQCRHVKVGLIAALFIYPLGHKLPLYKIQSPGMWIVVSIFHLHALVSKSPVHALICGLMV